MVARTPGQGGGESPSPLQHDQNDDESAQLVAALRAGDEQTFSDVVRRYNGVLLSVAMRYVSTRGVAEEVVQETWLGVVKGIERFEGRSSFKTWLFHILTNIAQTRGAREARTVPFSAVNVGAKACEDFSVEPERFLAPDNRWAGHWASPPRRPSDYPEMILESIETNNEIRAAINALPENLRQVVWLRDVEGLGARDVCELLDVTESNQRVLLHRARSRVRASLETHWEKSLLEHRRTNALSDRL